MALITDVRYHNGFWEYRLQGACCEIFGQFKRQSIGSSVVGGFGHGKEFSDAASLIFRVLNKGHHVKHFATDLRRTLVVLLGFKLCAVSNLRIFISDWHAKIAAHHEWACVVGLRTCHHRTVPLTWIRRVAVGFREAHLRSGSFGRGNAVAWIG